MIPDLPILLVLLFLSGFFSSAETALFSISITRARHIAKEPGRANYLINKLKEDPHKLLATILIGNNIANVAASAFATTIALKTFPGYALGFATGIMTFLILVFGEVFPKSVATRNNILIARLTIFPIYWFSLLFSPVIWFLQFIPKLTGKIKHSPTVTEQELMTFVEVVEEKGEIKEEEKELIHNIFEFDDTKASEIMTPRGDMFVIEVDQLLDMKAIAESGFTRIPVIEADMDHVVGILNIKDIFMYHATSNEKISIRQLMRPPYFVPENIKLDKLLQQFKKRKNHIAIIVDEHGGVSGLITLEDALEELVGEIRDETDKEEPYITKINQKEWIILGKSDIDMVNEIIGMDILDSNEYDTFSGFILDRIGRIPHEKESFTIGNHEVIVKEKDGNRIIKYIIKKLEIPSETQDTVVKNTVAP